MCYFWTFIVLTDDHSMSFGYGHMHMDPIAIFGYVKYDIQAVGGESGVIIPMATIF